MTVDTWSFRIEAGLEGVAEAHQFIEFLGFMVLLRAFPARHDTKHVASNVGQRQRRVFCVRCPKVESHNQRVAKPSYSGMGTRNTPDHLKLVTWDAIS